MEKSNKCTQAFWTIQVPAIGIGVVFGFKRLDRSNQKIVIMMMMMMMIRNFTSAKGVSMHI